MPNRLWQISASPHAERLRLDSAALPGAFEPLARCRFGREKRSSCPRPAVTSGSANPVRSTCKCGSRRISRASSCAMEASSSRIIHWSGVIATRCPHKVMKDRFRKSDRKLMNDVLCACSSRWNLSRRSTAILNTRIVCQVNLAGDPFFFGRTSAGISARLLVHSRSLSVERPVSSDATCVGTYRSGLLPRNGYRIQLKLENGYHARSLGQVRLWADSKGKQIRREI